MKTAFWTGLTWAGIMLIRLFAGGTVGLADQGDGNRLLCGFGAAVDRPWQANVWEHVYPTWLAHSWFGETCGVEGTGEAYRSTQLWLLWLAGKITPLLGLPGVIDLRALGVICAVLVGVVVGLLAWVLPGQWWVRTLAASAVGLVYADAAFAGFFVSPYAEPASLLGVGLLLVALLTLWRMGRATVPRVLFVSAAALFAIGSQIQLAALLVPVCLALLWLPNRRLSWWRPRWFGRTLRRLPAIVVCLALLAATGYHLARQPERQLEVALYDAVFGSILHDNPGAAKDLQDLGFPLAMAEELAKAADTTLLSDNSAAATPLYTEFRAQVTLPSLIGFYAGHPAHLVRTVGWGLAAIGRLAPDYLGSYPPDAGQPSGAREHRIAVYSWLWGIFRLAPVLLVLLWVATFAVGLSTVRRRRLKAPRKAVGMLAVTVPLMIVIQFGVAMLGGRVDAVRHLTTVSFLSAICLPLLALTLWVRLRGVRPRARLREAPGLPAVAAPDLARR
ncbi:glycan biosynthesis hexose transferase WsfD [Acrocarpospora catenulata]|uniref:glycan biosynthesis hexose transferase WsfD n=1 Tax=Acrocarpospora catenulata TaxID=2836182 RepID=UPI001BDB0073|nr:hypothetical protein [Acrocarpospora catenulata]